MQKENSYENFMPLQASLDMLLKNENLDWQKAGYGFVLLKQLNNKMNCLHKSALIFVYNNR